MEPHQTTDGKTSGPKPKAASPDSSCQASCNREPAAVPAVLPSCRHHPQHAHSFFVSHKAQRCRQGTEGCRAQLRLPKVSVSTSPSSRKPQSTSCGCGGSCRSCGSWTTGAVPRAVEGTQPAGNAQPGARCPGLARQKDGSSTKPPNAWCSEGDSRGLLGWGRNLCFGKGLQLSCSS